VHFIDADCRTTIGRQTRYFQVKTVESIRAFASRCNLEDTADFEGSMRAWSRGSNYASLSEDQYAKLKAEPRSW
jgi:hypothetical protein